MDIWGGPLMNTVCICPNYSSDLTDCPLTKIVQLQITLELNWIPGYGGLPTIYACFTDDTDGYPCSRLDLATGLDTIIFYADGTEAGTYGDYSTYQYVPCDGTLVLDNEQTYYEYYTATYDPLTGYEYTTDKNPGGCGQYFFPTIPCPPPGTPFGGHVTIDTSVDCTP